jgi:hypothetical protein
MFVETQLNAIDANCSRRQQHLSNCVTAIHTSARESLVPVSFDGDTSGTEPLAGEKLVYIAPDDAARVSSELWASGVEGNFRPT